jgi:hypothetical protein
MPKPTGPSFPLGPGFPLGWRPLDMSQLYPIQVPRTTGPSCPPGWKTLDLFQPHLHSLSQSEAWVPSCAVVCLSPWVSTTCSSPLLVMHGTPGLAELPRLLFLPFQLGSLLWPTLILAGPQGSLPTGHPHHLGWPRLHPFSSLVPFAVE